MSTRNPMARAEGLVVEDVDGELLIYDETSTRAHCLSEVAARVWRACDGNKGVDAIATELGLEQDVVVDAVTELERNSLLNDQGLEVLQSDSNNGRGITRRELGRRSAMAGSAVVAAPMILSITAPSAAAGISPTAFQCEIFTVQSCGSSTGGGSIKGCCCCCQQGGDCKVATSVNACNAVAPITGATGPTGPTGSLTTGAICVKGSTPTHCSSGAHSVPITGQQQVQGCCGQAKASLCGCGWGGGPGGSTDRSQCTPGNTLTFGSGSCCCDTANSNKACAPGSTSTCVPCCNGVPIMPGAVTGCCTSTGAASPTAPIPTPYNCCGANGTTTCA